MDSIIFNMGSGFLFISDPQGKNSTNLRVGQMAMGLILLEMIVV